MISANRPIINLDLDLLRTFVAVADLNTFAAAAAAVCRTQSAVSQQMQRLEQLVGKELFARHGRNKLLTEHGIQLLGYARKILRFNDEACSSLMFSNLQGVLTIGASDESADTILPFLLNRVSSVYPKLALDVRVKRNAYMAEMLESQEVDLMVTTHRPSTFKALNLRTSPTHWYCAAEYVLQKVSRSLLCCWMIQVRFAIWCWRRLIKQIFLATGLCRLDASGRSCGSESRSWRDGKAGRDDESGPACAEWSRWLTAAT